MFQHQIMASLFFTVGVSLQLLFTFGASLAPSRRPLNSNATPSSINCTWIYHTQPLDHFSTVANGGPSTYNERVCLYSNFVPSGTKNAPILFYVGNESPVEEYINNTGLMWNLGRDIHAHLVFAEHRYFGKSVPQLKGVQNCLAFCTSSQALADYASLVSHLKQNILPNAQRSAVVAFGGSYGGMLAAWARMKYPTSFQGAIAASAPIWGFPLDNIQLDGSQIPVTRSASTEGGATDTCKDNILAAWPIMRELGKTQQGRDLMVDAFDLCPVGPDNASPLPTPKSVETLIQYGHQPWFELAEGDYPFPSEYITYAVASTPSPLPAWPVRVACHSVGIDVDIQVKGNTSDVLFDVVIDGGKQTIHVDWNATSTTSNMENKENKKNNNTATKNVNALADSTSVQKLMQGLSSAIGVWYNVSGQKKCYHLDGSDGAPPTSAPPTSTPPTGTPPTGTPPTTFSAMSNKSTSVCTADSIPGGNAAAWSVLCCNENLNLVNTLVSGVGNDMFWPPSVFPRTWNRTQVIVDSSGPCYEDYASHGLYGVPTTSDPFANWLNVYYGGLDGPQESSNIVFSNGLLDPWSAAGVIDNISSSVVSVLLKYGGHHLDLFFPDENDPPCAIEARKIEQENVVKWVSEYNAKFEL